jgi:predicted PurR-regulated permease PerM
MLPWIRDMTDPTKSSPGILSDPPDTGPVPRPSRGGPGYGNEAIAPYFFLIIFGAALIAVGYVLLPFLGDMVIALVAVLLLTRHYKRLLRALGNRAVLASGLTVAVLVIVVAVPVTLVGSALLADIRRAAVTWGGPEAYVTLNDWTSENGRVARALTNFAQRTGLPISPEAIGDAVVEAARVLSQGLYKRANSFVSGVFQFALHGVITLFSIFYLLMQGEKLSNFLFRLSPLAGDEDQLFINKLGEVGRAILIGNGIGSSLQGLVAGLAWAVVGLPSPVLWGLVMAVAAFLPLVGVAAVVVPATFYLWFTGRHLVAVGFLIFCMGQSFLFEYGLKPRLMGSSMRMNSLLVFLSLLGGILGFGAPGILYGPLIMTLFLAIAQLYVTRYQQRIAVRLAASVPPEIRPSNPTGY